MRGGSAGVWDARLRKAKALQAEAELRRVLGEFIPADEVRDAAYKEGKRIRDSFMAMPDRLAPVLAAESDPIKIRKILMKELKQVLEGLARDNSK